MMYRYVLAALTGLCVFWPCSLAIGQDTSQPPPEIPVAVKSLLKKRLLCGPNSLYLLLKLRGYFVRYADLEKELPVGERGVSMLQLRDAALRWGLRSKVRQYAATEKNLLQCSLPLIAHIDKESNRRPEGHYVVVVDLVRDGEERGVWVIDGTSAKRMRYDWDHFLRYWDGYVLEPRESSWELWLVVGTLPLLVVLGILALRGNV